MGELDHAIDHVVVLALENRSFDHLLGYLDHPAGERFDGLRGPGPYRNLDGGGRPVDTSAGTKPVLPAGPAHSHREVLAQLAVGPGDAATNAGFVTSYARATAGTPALRYAGLLGPLLTLWSWLRSGRRAVRGLADPDHLVMRCHDATTAPVMHTLAREFGVCTRWFCSVPGETWPNRIFLHAATSEGETGNRIRPYEARTIFELIEDHDADWQVYHADTPQLWAFPRLWDRPDRHARWFPLTAFTEHVAAGTLPSYSFLEPDHGIPVVDQVPGSNSQHPENNLVEGAAYPGFDVAADGPRTDFARGEALVALVYEALRANPRLFARTLLLITYDEHGGFYDHVPPPHDVPAPGSGPPPRRWWDRLLRLAEPGFAFTRLGPRVPAIVVSPRVPAGLVDDTVRDHAAVPATLRALFAPGADPLTRRDAWSPPFHELAGLTVPRRPEELPDLSAYTPDAAQPVAGAATPGRPAATHERLPEHLAPFAAQAALVHDHLEARGEPELAGESRRRSSRITTRFAEAAERHRRVALAAPAVGSPVGVRHGR